MSNICYNESGDFMEANKEVRNDELKVAMITLNLQDDKESEEAFIKLLKSSILIIPAVDDDKKDEFTFMLLANQDQDHYFQCYTDMDEYNKWNDAKESREFFLSFDELANIVVSSDSEIKGLVINPFSENIVLNREAVKDIFSNDKVFIDGKKECPKEIKRKMKRVLEKKKSINCAYILCIIKNNIPGYLLIIDVKTKDIEKLFNEIREEINNSIDEINLDIMTTKYDIAEELIKDMKPFYEK